MATTAFSDAHVQQREHFFEWMAIFMAAIVVIGFSTHWTMGRSSFMVSPIFHVHALAFMGWVALFVVQTRLGTRGPVELHRRLGWLGVGWTVLLIVMGFWLTAHVVSTGQSPFIFLPQYFLIANPLSIFCFAALTWWAVRMRRRTDWHSRLHICAMAAIMGPAIGRLLPLPLLIPNAFDIAFLAGMIFPAIGMVRDLRRSGRVHPAWLLGALSILAVIPAAHLLASSAFGDWAYASITAGQAGASVPGLVQPPFPPMP